MRRKEAHERELQGAQICSLLYNINRDGQKSKAKMPAEWCYFKEPEVKDSDQLPAVVAHACLSLRHEGKLPPLMLGVWKDIIDAAKGSISKPKVRALISEDKDFVIVAPEWESKNIRGFLCVRSKRRGEVIEVHDVDKPLLSYRVTVPANVQAVHFEADVLLLVKKKALKATFK
ncbi:MAG: hypothetical protein GY899_11220 [Verrucomicrobiaceae bacterium]|nr:hypothetical protein [Verrucomicrobiaceae bacterium]